MPYQILNYNTPAKTDLSSGYTSSWGTSNIETQESQSEFVQNYANRSGTNRNAGNMKTRKTRAPISFVMVQVPTTRYVRKRVYDEKRRKFVTTRTAVQSVRLIKKKKYGRVILNPNELLPNDIFFFTSKHHHGTYAAEAKKTQYYGSDSITFYRNMAGNTLRNLSPPWRRNVYLLAENCNPQAFEGHTLGVRCAIYVAELTSSAHNELNGRVKRMSLNAAQALAERRQTADMIATMSRTALQSILKLKAGNIGGAAKTLFPSDSKKMASSFLCYEYGIRPLLSDIDAAMKVLADSYVDIAPLDTTVVKKRNIANDDQRPWSGGALPSSGNGHFSQVLEITVKAKARYSILDTLDRSAATLGFTNPALLAWELIPFSFVADWFLPVGNFLNAVDAGLDVNAAWHTTSVFIRETVSFTAPFGGTDRDGFNWSAGQLSWTAENIYFKRNLEAGLPEPAFPRLNTDMMSVRHLLDAIALLR